MCADIQKCKAAPCIFSGRKPHKIFVFVSACISDTPHSPFYGPKIFLLVPAERARHNYRRSPQSVLRAEISCTRRTAEHARHG